MSDATQILSQIESGDPAAAEQLLPLVYDEFRKLAPVRTSQENPAQKLQAIHDGLIDAVSTYHVLTVLDAANGQTVYKMRLNLGSKPVWASLCVAGNYLYVSSRDGTTLVIETGRRYKELSRDTLEYFISTPVFHENRMYVRTSERLYCIGES